MSEAETCEDVQEEVSDAPAEEDAAADSDEPDQEEVHDDSDMEEGAPHEDIEIFEKDGKVYIKVVTSEGTRVTELENPHESLEQIVDGELPSENEAQSTQKQRYPLSIKQALREVCSLGKQFLYALLNYGKVEANNQRILQNKGNSNISVLVLGTLQWKDHAARFVEYLKSFGEDCYVIPISYDKPLDEIAEEVSNEINNVKEQTKASRITAYGFSLGGSALLVADRLGFAGGVDKMRLINPIVAESGTFLSTIIEAISGTKSDKNYSILRQMTSRKGRIPTDYIHTIPDGIVPPEPNIAVERVLGGDIYRIDGAAHLTPMLHPNILATYLNRGA